ncbi:MAG: HAMP domain-containing histidine kinase [Arcobacteraceae bacterium]|nr:HAMP domain-containing histidine kinase [Arcobacteraceae bacterium]
MLKKLDIKAKSLIFLISAVGFALLIAGVLQYFYLYNYHKSNAFEKISMSQSIVKKELELIEEQNINIINDVTHDTQILSNLSVIANYQDKSNYQPILFDEMKKELLYHIKNKFVLFDNICFGIFDTDGEVVTYMLNNNIVKYEHGISTYENDKLQVVDVYSNIPISTDREAYKISQETLNEGKSLNKYEIITKDIDNHKVLCLVKTIKLIYNDVHIGYLKLSRHIDSTFVENIANKTSTMLDIYHQDFDFNVINIENHKSLFTNTSQLSDDDNSFFKIEKYLFDDNEVFIINAIPKDEFNAQILNSIIILVLSILVAMIFVLPLMYMFIQKDVINPIKSLFAVTKSIKHNNYNIEVNIESTDLTINTFATSFKSMIDAIKQRDKEIKIRNFYDKLIASSSAKFINTKLFDEQVYDTLRLIKMSLKAQRVSLETSVSESTTIKKDYKVGLDCKYKELCEDCLCIEKLFENKTKEIVFIKDVSSDETFQECRIFIEQKIKSLVVIPIFHKENRLAILVIEFTQIKNAVDENYSYLLKPLATIFGNVINQEIQDELSISREQMLFQQSKMAAMGEMIGNIAHQWRQPLSAITTSSSGLKLKDEYGLLTKEDIIDFNESILNNANYLSKTIDDFRNFFKTSKEIEVFDAQKLVENSLKLVESALKHHYIDVELSVIQNANIEGYFSEAIQAIINILNNAKDAIESHDIEQKVLLISIDKVNNFVCISITDSGGGIPDTIRAKIFEPYFTTKHQSQGTGIGLYMSNEIVSKHLHGKIEVENIAFSYKDKECFGAQFKIYLPISGGEV